ncbi:MAG: DNA-processing protein DprA [Patescibacteria group bacterium]
MLNTIQTLTKEQYPYLLRQISALPKKMDLRGTLPSDDNKFLCVIGARKCTSYGKEVCAKLIRGLKGYPIVIVSGLAIGIDSIAHEEALAAGLKVIAFPGSGLADHVLYPSSSRQLAHKIIESGNALLSPFDLEQGGADWTFPARNRLMAGTSHATLIIEASTDSGTLITSGFAADFGRELLVVPNSVFIETSYGSNNLLREGGTAVTNSEEVLEGLGFETTLKNQQLLLNLSELSLSPEEQLIIECLRVEPLSSSDIIEKTLLPPSLFNIKVSELELRGFIVESGGQYRLGSLDARH